MPSPPREPDSQVSPRFARKILVGAGIVVVVLCGAILLWQAVWVLLVVFAGILLAVLLDTLVDWMGRWIHLRRGWILLIVAGILIVVLAIAVYIAAGPVAEQFAQLEQQLPTSLDKTKAFLNQYDWGKQLIEHFWPSPDWGRNQWLVTRATSAASAAITVAVTILVILAVGVYLAAEPDTYINGLVSLFPHAVRPRIREVLHETGMTLRWWIIGQCVTMVVIGSLTMLGLWIIGIPLAFLIGLLAALFNFIPNFGPLVSFIPAILLAITIEPMKVIWVGLLWIVAQSLEGYVVTPLVQRQTVWLPPGLSIVVQVLMGVLVGPIGLVMAHPLTAVSNVVVKMLYVEDVMGDKAELTIPENSETAASAPSANNS
jgi:predicted PurR-regulated permease PerM